MSIGYHQGLEVEVDVHYCNEHKIPVLRREVGGGTVYIDENQLFTQWIMTPETLPLSMEKRFELFTRPLVTSYQQLGIPAYFHPLNDIHVAGKKITGTGAARIGNAEVLVGNFLLDFNNEVMSRILNTPSPAFRNHLEKGLHGYLTTIQRELGRTPPREDLVDLYRKSCEESLGIRVEPGSITEEEWRTIKEVEARFLSTAFQSQDGGLKRDGVKIHQDVWIRERIMERHGVQIRATGTLRQNHLDRLTLESSPALHPASILTDLAAALLGTELESDNIGNRIETICAQKADTNPGITTRDWVDIVLGLKEKRR